MTWARNDKQYVSLTDGSGWPDVAGYIKGQSYNSRVYGIDGDPPDISFEHLPGFPDLLSIDLPEQHSRYYGFGILAVDDAIYHFLSTPNHSFDYPEPRFVGAKLIFSPDSGRTWKNQDGSPLLWEPREERTRENMVFFY